MRLIVVVFLPHSFHCLVRLRVGHVWSRCSSTMLGFCATIQISLLPIPIFSRARLYILFQPVFVDRQPIMLRIP